MAGSSTNWDVTAIAQTPGLVWWGLAIPGANAELTLHTDGTPESVANPSAKHGGHTTEGSEFLVKPSYTEFYVDELPDPAKRNVDKNECAISGAFVQVADLAKMADLLPGVATYSTPTNKQKIALGRTTIVYQSVAVIFPLEADPTKFGVFHLYKALSDAGLAVQLGLKKMASSPFAFKGQAITSRATTDTTGAYWKQT